MYRSFSLKTMHNNRDGYQKYVDLFIKDDDLTPLFKAARSFAKEHGITRIPPFVPEHIPGHRGGRFNAVSKSHTGIRIIEIFA